jgi:hypothetical protein
LFVCWVAIVYNDSYFFLNRYNTSMADYRDIMDSRLKNFNRFLGVLKESGDSSSPLRIYGYQRGTISVRIDGIVSPIKLVFEGSPNPSQGWFNLSSCVESLDITVDGMYSATFEAEMDYFRVRVKEGEANRIEPTAFISKNIISK